MNRRSFIEQSCFACLATGAGLSLLSLESCSTAKVVSIEPEGGKFKVAVSSFTPESNTLLVRTKQLEHDILVLKSGDSYKAFYMQCTHQNNPVNYTSGGIVCNAHGSRFDLQGNATLGPADKALKQYNITLENNFLILTPQ